MRRLLLAGVAALCVVVSSGCYHATVRTNATPSTLGTKDWAHGWLWGLVGPPRVHAEQVCGVKGVARVETQLSFLNQFVSFLTIGLYAPMTYEVTCAQ